MFLAAARHSPLRRGFRRQAAGILDALRPGPIDTTFRGASFRVYPLNSSVEYRLLVDPGFERVEIEFLSEALGGGSVFVDVGAHIGVYALVLAKASGPGGRIVAIEPNPVALRRLEANRLASGVGNVTIVPEAAGEASSRLRFRNDERELGKSRVAEDGTILVAARPLTSILGNLGINRIEALKIDVEGFEDRVLVPFLRTVPAELLPARMVVEENPERWATDLRAVAAAAGYNIAGRTKNNILFERSRAAPASIRHARVADRP